MKTLLTLCLTLILVVNSRALAFDSARSIRECKNALISLALIYPIHFENTEFQKVRPHSDDLMLIEADLLAQISHAKYVTPDQSESLAKSDKNYEIAIFSFQTLTLPSWESETESPNYFAKMFANRSAGYLGKITSMKTTPAAVQMTIKLANGHTKNISLFADQKLFLRSR